MNYGNPFTSVTTPPAAAPPVTGAANGLSLSGTNVILGGSLFNSTEQITMDGGRRLVWSMQAVGGAMDMNFDSGGNAMIVFNRGLSANNYVPIRADANFNGAFTGLNIQQQTGGNAATAQINLNTTANPVLLGYAPGFHATFGNTMFFSGAPGYLFRTNAGNAFSIDSTNVVTAVQSFVAPVISTAPGLTDSNLYVGSASTIVNTNVAEYRFSGATNVQFRVGVRGATNGGLLSNRSYSSVIIGNQAVTENSSGTHALLAQMLIRELTITGAGATVTNTASFVVTAAAAATVAGKNYAIWSQAGENRFGGLTTFDAGITTGTPGGAGAGTWLLGTVVAAAAVLDNANYLELNVDGVLKKVALIV